MNPPSSSSSISLLHADILRSHILTRLDGPTLASAACASAELKSLASHDPLWTNICRSTWPSTDSPRLRHLLSSFGARSFFSNSFPLLLPISSPSAPPRESDRPSELISAVDLHYRGELIFSRVAETETVSGWFRCWPFRIDMLDPKDTCPTPIPRAEREEGCGDVAENLALSWILVDPAGQRAMNLSSQRAVSVHRHWLRGEVHTRFATVLAGERGSASEFVQCGIVVTCGGGGKGEGMSVREVSMQVEDMDGMFLNGKDSLGILERAFEGKRGNRARREGVGRRRYEEFLEMKRERRERRLRTEGTLDMLCVAFGALTIAALGLFLFCG